MAGQVEGAPNGSSSPLVPPPLPPLGPRKISASNFTDPSELLNVRIIFVRHPTPKVTGNHRHVFKGRDQPMLLQYFQSVHLLSSATDNILHPDNNKDDFHVK